MPPRPATVRGLSLTNAADSKFEFVPSFSPDCVWVPTNQSLGTNQTGILASRVSYPQSAASNAIPGSQVPRVRSGGSHDLPETPLVRNPGTTFSANDRDRRGIPAENCLGP